MILRRATLLFMVTFTGPAMAETPPEQAKQDTTSCPLPANPIVIAGPTPEPICIPIRRGTWTTIIIPEGARLKLPDPKHPKFDRNPEPERSRIHVKASRGVPLGTRTEYKLIGPDYTNLLRLEAAEPGTQTDILIKHESLEQARIRQLEHEVVQRDKELWRLRGHSDKEIERLESELVVQRKSAKENKSRQSTQRTRIGKLKQEIADRDEQIRTLESKLKDTEAAKAEAERQEEKAKLGAAEADRRTKDVQRAERRHRLANDARHIGKQRKRAQVAEFHPLYDKDRPLGPDELPIKLETALWDSAGDWLLADFKCQLPSLQPRPLVLTMVSVETHAGDIYEAELLNLTRMSREPGVLAVIYPGEDLTGTLAINVGRTNPLRTLPHQIKLSAITGEVSFVANLRGWSPKIVELAMLPEKPRDEWARLSREDAQVIIAPRLVGGAFWLSNGLKGDSRELKAAGFAGGGVRVTKGVTELLAFEGELAGGGTSQASFGSVKRSGYFGRLQAGAAFRFGHEKMPILRFGLALIGARYTLDTVDESEWEFATPLLFGFGYLRRFSEQWVVSVSGSVISSTEELRTLEAGIQIGYGFTPGYKPR